MVAPAPLNELVVTTPQALTTLQVVTADILINNFSDLMVQADLDATASGDLIVNVFPYLGSNTVLGLAKLTATVSTGPTFLTNRASYYAIFNVRGLEKAQLQITNNNAGTKNLNQYSWRLGG